MNNSNNNNNNNNNTLKRTSISNKQQSNPFQSGSGSGSGSGIGTNLFQQQQQQQQQSHDFLDQNKNQNQQPPQQRRSSLYRYVETPPTPINIFTKRASVIPNVSGNGSGSGSGIGAVPMTPVTPIAPTKSGIYHNNFNTPISNSGGTGGSGNPIPMTASRKSVTVSAIKPKVHIYPSSPAGSNSENQSSSSSTFPISPYSSNSNNISTQFMDNSSFYWSPDDVDDIDQLEAQELFYIPGKSDISVDSGGSSSTMADSNRSTPAKIKPKTIKQRIQDITSYPINKWDEYHEEALILFNHPFYNSCIYVLCIILNALLFGYSIELFGNNVHLYRYTSNHFQSPNMHIEAIETPMGSVDNVVVLSVWEPKFTCKTIFTFFSPLHVALMVSAGSDLNRFINSTILSILISLGVCHQSNNKKNNNIFNRKYDGKIRDEKILFSQLCEEYNHQFKPKLGTMCKDAASQTSR
ncbi:transmembrane protein [Heterostelium album PN500]|uniref:Transmembrane protein n=1 Tax=Heterostelium pallidum (strain ATCC 26659 / Pp 5 / PN500) TaxID=670386 RepID=D3B9Y6_HETP5|nr:transmembrane protein [Heterostelium album PN500]EFA81373.1 transmembrane protein [Heterostelium album PN500]|eukprot:XP_020433491.1 transmembrane protein [Heterostelium album PN500]